MVYICHHTPILLHTHITAHTIMRGAPKQAVEKSAETMLQHMYSYVHVLLYPYYYTHRNKGLGKGHISLHPYYYKIHTLE